MFASLQEDGTIDGILLLGYDSRSASNYSHSRRIRIVECDVGMMAKKFCLLETSMLTHQDVAESIVLVGWLLHIAKKG